MIVSKVGSKRPGFGATKRNQKNRRPGGVGAERRGLLCWRCSGELLFGAQLLALKTVRYGSEMGWFGVFLVKMMQIHATGSKSAPQK